MPLEGRRVLVTGGGSGLGRELALEAARRGAHVRICGRCGTGLAETAERETRGRTEWFVADVTEASDRARLVRWLEVRGGLDILVNNAGVQTVGPLSELGDAGLTAMVTTNLTAPAALTRDCLPLLRAGRTPRIVNVGSMFGDIGFPLFAVYSASKFGLRGLSDALRRELAPDGIAVTYLAPRAIRTAATERSAHLIEPFKMKLDAPEDVARRAWNGVERGHRVVYPGAGERLAALLQHLLPTVIDRSLMNQLNRVTSRMSIIADTAGWSARLRQKAPQPTSRVR